MNILSIDPATSSGIARFEDGKITVYNMHCKNPCAMFQYWSTTKEMYRAGTVLLEDFVFWNKVPNPKTTSSLVKRIGYIEHRFKEIGLPVEMMHVGSVRKSLGIKGPSAEAKLKVNQQLRELTGLVLTTDISDALAQLLSYLEHDSLEAVLQYELTRVKNVNLKP